MQKIYVTFTVLLTLLFTGCEANRYENYLGIPRNQAGGRPETVLLVSTLSNKFYISKGFSTNSYPFAVGNIVNLSLVTAKNEINQRDLRVIASQHYALNDTSINQQLRDQLRQLNSRYHADYVIVILGTPRLSCPTAMTINHDRNVSPLTYNLSIEVLSGRSLEYVFSQSLDAVFPQESTWGMVPENYPLCVEIPEGRDTTAKRYRIAAWLEQQTVVLTKDVMQSVLHGRLTAR